MRRNQTAFANIEFMHCMMRRRGDPSQSMRKRRSRVVFNGKTIFIYPNPRGMREREGGG